MLFYIWFQPYSGLAIRSGKQILQNREIHCLWKHARGTKEVQKRKDSSVGQEMKAAKVFEGSTAVGRAGKVENDIVGPSSPGHLP